jgi:Gliding motility associated protein GldN
MRFFKTLLFLVFSNNIFSQIDSLMKDSNVIWITDFEYDLSIDSKHKDDTTYSNDIGILKYTYHDDWELKNHNSFFSSILYEASYVTPFEVYEDRDLKDTSSSLGGFVRIQEPDIDPITYETKMCGNAKLYKVNDIIKYRVHQFLYYDKSEARFKFNSIKVAPLVGVFNKNGILDSLLPLFWFKTENMRPDVNQKSITWAQRLRTQTSDVIFSNLKVIKNTFNNSPLVHQFEIFKTDEKKGFYSYNYSDGINKNVPLWVRENILTEIDTFSENGSLKLKINKPKAESINRMRLIQDWFWDNEKKKLMIYLVATAPLMPFSEKGAKDDSEHLLDFKSIFFRRTEGD